MGWHVSCWPPPCPCRARICVGGRSHDCLSPSLPPVPVRAHRSRLAALRSRRHSRDARRAPDRVHVLAQHEVAVAVPTVTGRDHSTLPVTDHALVRAVAPCTRPAYVHGLHVGQYLCKVDYGVSMTCEDACIVEIS